MRMAAFHGDDDDTAALAPPSTATAVAAVMGSRTLEDGPRVYAVVADEADMASSH